MGFYLLLKTSGKTLSNKHSLKLLDSAKKSATDLIKTTSKLATLKIAEVTGDLIGNKTADKITNTSKASSQNSWKTAKREAENIELNIEIPKEICIAPEKRQQILGELRLIEYINKMGHHKIINLLDYQTTQPSKFGTKNWVKINNQSNGIYETVKLNLNLEC